MRPEEWERVRLEAEAAVASARRSAENIRAVGFWVAVFECAGGLLERCPECGGEPQVSSSDLVERRTGRVVASYVQVSCRLCSFAAPVFPVTPGETACLGEEPVPLGCDLPVMVAASWRRHLAEVAS